MKDRSILCNLLINLFGAMLLFLAFTAIMFLVMQKDFIDNAFISRLFPNILIMLFPLVAMGFKYKRILHFLDTDTEDLPYSIKTLKIEYEAPALCIDDFCKALVENGFTVSYCDKANGVVKFSTLRTPIDLGYASTARISDDSVMIESFRLNMFNPEKLKSYNEGLNALVVSNSQWVS